MVLECGCEVIVQLNTNGTESGQRVPLYLPPGKGQKMNFGSILVTVHAVVSDNLKIIVLSLKLFLTD